MLSGSTGYLLIGAVFGILSMLVSSRLKSKFKKYSEESLSNGMTGREIAEKMLSDHGITDVEVISVSGQLTDHYNPQNKTVNLSSVVYDKRNTAAAAVAAHEVGHAVQHAKAYKWLTMRSKLVPVVSVASKATQFILMGGFMFALLDYPIFLWMAIAIFGIVALFSIITLPVEYDASNRALAWMKNAHITNEKEYSIAKDALKWAARTYLVAALAAIANVMFFIIRLLSGRQRN